MKNQKKEYDKIKIPPDIITKAEEGDATAQLQLGKVYYKTTSIENNNTIAFDWIHRSAQKGNMEAQFRLGDMYALGYGTAKNIPESYNWYTKAAIQGYKKALVRIHNLYQQDLKMQCRGQLNAEEQAWASNDYKKANNIRELYEYRLEQLQPILNGAINYYTQQFKHHQSADQKDPVVQLNLAFLYQHGYGAKKWIRWAFEYYLLAAEQGNVDAQYNLGYLYEKHTRKKFNYRHAFKWYTKSAESGSMIAQRCLAYFYLKGLVIDIDYEIARYWYTKAAQAGDTKAQVALGMLYRKGNYVQKDLLMAVTWYTMAARQGSVVAQNCLTQLYQRGDLTNIELEKDMLVYLTEDSINNRLCPKLSADISQFGDPSKFKEINKVAKHALIGDGPAMYEIGLRYFHVANGFPHDKDTGIIWIKNAAKRGHIAAQYMMAELYKKGDAIEQDYYKSCMWYKTLAKHKFSDAQCQVGMMYNKGLGVRKDLLEASRWFIWAADQGNSDAEFYFGMLRLKGDRIKKDEKEARKRFHKSLHQNNPHICFEVGKLFLYSSISIEKTQQKIGIKLLEFAAKHGCEGAQLLVGGIYINRTYVERDAQKAIAFYSMAADSGSAEAQYNLAIIYLHRYGVKQDFIKAYNLFKEAKDKNHEEASNLFQVPIKNDENKIDYYEVRDMFIEVTEKEIDDLSYTIGSMYEYGIDRDIRYRRPNFGYAEAIEWYLAASKKGDIRADYRLGIMYEFGIGVEKNLPTARYYYNIAATAENGIVNAMYRLACTYITGYASAEHFLEAFYLYTKASILGHCDATKVLTIFQHDEYIIYTYDYPDKDRDIRLDKGKLIGMFEKAIEEGYTLLRCQLSIMYERNGDYPKAFDLLSHTEDFGMIDVYYRLGVMYEEGKGVKQNYIMAVDMYKKAAMKDHEDAFFRLRQLYQYGNGVELDHIKAYQYYKKAAEMNHDMATRVLNITLDTKLETRTQKVRTFFDVTSNEYQNSVTMCKYVAEDGNTEIQFKLGFVYEHCYPEADYEEAFKWYSMAAKSSHREAMYYLGLLYERGLVVPQDYQKAIKLYNHACQLGSGDAQYRLGTVYHFGKGVAIDSIKALEFYTLSAKSGNPEYQFKLGQLHEEGELGKKNLLEALKWYTKAYLQGYDNVGSKLDGMYEDIPYESFFFKKLFQNLSVASDNILELNGKSYKYEDFGDINNRLGLMYFLGMGVDKSLNLSLQYLLKEYSDRTMPTIIDFTFFENNDLEFTDKFNILKEAINDEKYINQLGPEELYEIGMVFYNGKVKSQHCYKLIRDFLDFPIEVPDKYDTDEHNVFEKDYSTALKYLKRAADKQYPKTLLKLGIMYHCGYGVQKDSNEGDAYFNLVPCDNDLLMKDMAILYHTHNDIQDFSKAFKYYNHLKSRVDVVINQAILTGLGLLYEYGDGVDQDYEKALDYYNKAKDHRNKVGYLRLGLMHYHGKGIPVDCKEAFNLFRKAIHSSDEEYYVPYVYDENDSETSDVSQKKLIYCTKTNTEIQKLADYYKSLIYKSGLITKEEYEKEANFDDSEDEIVCQHGYDTDDQSFEPLYLI